MEVIMTTPDKIADFFLKYAAEFGEPLTQLKLQKLAYYAQAWHLALCKKPLFKEDFQAWVYGPALPTLYRKYKRFGYNPIKVPKNLSFPKLNSETRSFLEEVYRKYGKLEASQLVRLIHSEEPWKNARKCLEADESCKSIISKKSMQKYYSSLL
jgi:uncharacterized phage-associated protein